jgi:hypothetical protein
MRLFGLILTSSVVLFRHQSLPDVGKFEWRSQSGFTSIAGIRELADGRVIIVDTRERRLIALSAAGVSLRDIGRIGEGPGEFALLHSVMPFTADSTIVTDVMLRRYLVIGPDLTIARTTALPSTASWATTGEIVGRPRRNPWPCRDAHQLLSNSDTFTTVPSNRRNPSGHTVGEYTSDSDPGQGHDHHGKP